MKQRYTKNNRSNKSKKTFLQSNNTYVALFAAGFFSLVLISACSPDTFSDDSSIAAEQSDSGSDKNLQDAKDIQNNIKNSYARLASKRSNICPKLIQEEIDSQVIERTEEVMVDNHCDYFLYPRNGQHISVSTNDSQIEALLIVPTLHDFANGDYQVSSYDKHVVRLSYNGATYKPEHFVYDVAVTVSN